MEIFFVCFDCVNHVYSRTKIILETFARFARAPMCGNSMTDLHRHREDHLNLLNKN
ncbi:unnamed protein product [Amoebophrya sp. A25]|nr:unnamed protein product [Amoebophrya sp. A25]|eukprot:GSA25T00015740001.1